MHRFILDGWQYGWHRYFHINTFLYRHIHSWHHRLYVPYAYGALYNHPIEGFVLDTAGAAVAHKLVGFTTREATIFFFVSSAKTVDDHSGFAIPWDPLQFCFANNTDYHDIHHQIAGLKKNFSQPYFIHFECALLSCWCLFGRWGCIDTLGPLSRRAQHMVQHAHDTLRARVKDQAPQGRGSSRRRAVRGKRAQRARCATDVGAQAQGAQDRLGLLYSCSPFSFFTASSLRFMHTHSYYLHVSSSS